MKPSLKLYSAQVSVILLTFSVNHVPLVTARKSRVLAKDVLNTSILNMEKFTWFTTRDKEHTK